jgi:peptidyl-prolyl cis-trans isomerase D
MLRTFRHAAKSKFGTTMIALVGVIIVAGFAWGDISSLSLGNAGLSPDVLAEAGKMDVTDRDMSSAMQRRLGQVRAQNPEATYADLVADFDPLLESLIELRALEAFAAKNGFILSKRLVDAEIAKLPGVRGLGGQVSAQGYQAFLSQQHMSDAEVRSLIGGTLLQQLLVTPVASNARVPVGMATPYASMLLEEREGQVQIVPIQPFAAGLNPTDSQIQQYYSANRNRYMVPEQRVLKLARVGPEQVAAVSATPQEIEAYYKAHQDVYGPKDIRTIDQAVVPDQKVAAAIAQRARSGQSFVDAVKPAGLGAADVQLGQQNRADFTDVAGEKVASAAWSAKAGEIVGPIQSPLGWHVIKIESSQRQPGKTLAQASAEIAAKVSEDKRKNALADLVDKVQDQLDGGANFDQAAKASNLKVMKTPLITASGIQRDDPSFKFPPELAPSLKSGFEIAPTDEPVLEQLAEDRGFVLVAPSRVVPSAPAPLASIRDQVRSDWIRQQALARAKAVADSIAAKARGRMSLADAAKAAGMALPPVSPVKARRIQLSQLGDKVPEPLRVIFASAAGTTKVGGDPQGRGFFVAKVDKITPGNALGQPGLINELQSEFAQPLAQEYAQQFLNALKADVRVRRNAAAISAAKKRITAPAQ